MPRAFGHLAFVCLISPAIAQSVPPFSEHLLQQAKSGDDAAQRSLAYNYFYGRGTPKNLSEAAVWYKTSADRGNPSSAANFAVVKIASATPHSAAASNSQRLALLYFTKAAEGGYVPAYVGLADLYANSKNFAAAAIWYRKAADLNIAVAEFELGHLYLEGKGVPKDEIQGKALLKKAAKQGNLSARNMLAADPVDHNYSGYYGGFTPMSPMMTPAP